MYFFVPCSILFVFLKQQTYDYEICLPYLLLLLPVKLVTQT